MRQIFLAAAALLIAVALADTTLAGAADPARQEYKSQAEPICKANKAVSDRYLTGVSGLVKAEKLDKAAQNFIKAAAGLEKAQKQLAAVPQPPEDSVRLAKWLSGIKDEVALMRRIAAKLNAGSKGQASSLGVKLQHNATATNNLVVPFQFTYCKIDPSKYT